MWNENEHEQAREVLRTPRDCLRWAETLMRREQVVLGHGTDDYWDEALAMLLHCLHLPWDTDPRMLDARLLPHEVDAFLALLRKRVNERVPTAYLTGRAWFCGLEFRVDPRVLIPRSPTAELIERGMAPFVDPERVARVLDLGTGSGCMAIACAHAFPEAQVDAADVSEAALEVCRDNIAFHEMEEQVRPIISDGLASVQGPYDLILSNPPYVNAAEMAALPEEYRHEPELALAAGEDGLDFVRRLLCEAPEQLAEDGVLVVEVGNSWDAVERNWPEVPFFWFEFERGGHGVFMLDRNQLLEYRHVFAASERAPARQ